MPINANSDWGDLAFRHLASSDLPFIHELYRSTRWQELTPLPWSDDDKTTFLQQQCEAQHQHYHTHYPKADFFVIESAQQPIGRLYIDRGQTTLCLIDIAFLPDCRHQGFGSRILGSLIDEANTQQQTIVLHVERFNPAYDWYVRHGFQQIEDRGVYQYLEKAPSTL